MPHPDEGLIHAWLDGELDPAEAARVEARVASDGDWAAAAAEARGLIAASARIVGALDRAPANVIPKAAPARPASRRWVWRAAAVLALMAGSAVVLERETPDLPAPNAKQQPAPNAKPQPAPDAKVAAKKSSGHTGELADAKPAEAARDNNAVPAAADLRAAAASAGRAMEGASAAGAERRAANAPMAAVAQPRAPELQADATDKLTRLQPSCFEQREPREPRDSAARIIRLTAAALADSIRLETLVLRGNGDTLAAVNGRFTAVRVRCPEP